MTEIIEKLNEIIELQKKQIELLESQKYFFQRQQHSSNTSAINKDVPDAKTMIEEARRKIMSKINTEFTPPTSLGFPGTFPGNIGNIPQIRG
jgi:hypothetical protein